MRDKVVVVTGASSGIGAALAVRVAAGGAQVALAARREDALREVASRCGPRALPVVADLTRRADARRLVSAALERFGHIDVWVNNVGQGITRPPSQLADADIDAMMSVNVKTALYGMQEVLPHFIARGTGHIVNVSSMLGRVPYAIYRSAYAGAKHFLNALTASFRAELQEHHPGIILSLVSPGPVRTEFGRNALYGGPDSHQLPNTQSAEEIADVIAGVIESPRHDVYARAGSKERVLQYFETTTEDP